MASQLPFLESKNCPGAQEVQKLLDCLQVMHSELQGEHALFKANSLEAHCWQYPPWIIEFY